MNIKGRVRKLEDKIGMEPKESIVRIIRFSIKGSSNSSRRLPSEEEQIRQQREAGKHLIVVEMPYSS
jgi:hypothetical protein